MRTGSASINRGEYPKWTNAPTCSSDCSLLHHDLSFRNSRQLPGHYLPGNMCSAEFVKCRCSHHLCLEHQFQLRRLRSRWKQGFLSRYIFRSPVPILPHCTRLLSEKLWFNMPLFLKRTVPKYILMRQPVKCSSDSRSFIGRPGKENLISH